jgi:hypothetical protein
MPRIRTSSDPRGLDNLDLVDGAFAVRALSGKFDEPDLAAPDGDLERRTAQLS